MEAASNCFLYARSVAFTINGGGRRSCNRMVVGFTTTFVISAYRSWRSIRDTILCDKVCQ